MYSESFTPHTNQLTLQCQIHCAREINASSIKWYKDDIELDHGTNPKYSFCQNNTRLDLLINNPNAADSGKYKCQIEENGNILKSISHCVDVPHENAVPKLEVRRRRRTNELVAQAANEHKQPIAFESFMKNLTIEEGNRAKFICGVVGKVKLVEWYKDNELLQIETDHRYRSTLSDALVSLEVFNVQVGDSGFYTCCVSDQRNSTTSSSKLTVYESYKPRQKAPMYERPSIRSQLSEYIAKGIVDFIILYITHIYKNKYIVKPLFVKFTFSNERRWQH